jgi:hypothetical protein
VRIKLRIRKRRKARGSKPSDGDCESSNAANPPDTKPNAQERTADILPAWQPECIKHGGYGRRMLLSDAITEDAKLLTLDDELVLAARGEPDGGGEHRALAG